MYNWDPIPPPPIALIPYIISYPYIAILPNSQLSFLHIKKVANDTQKRLINKFLYMIIVPEEGTSDYYTMLEAAKLRNTWRDEGSHAWNKTMDRQRHKRATLPPDTDLTIQLYVIVDYYLYLT